MGLKRPVLQFHFLFGSLPQTSVGIPSQTTCQGSQLIHSLSLLIGPWAGFIFAVSGNAAANLFVRYVFGFVFPPTGCLLGVTESMGL